MEIITIIVGLIAAAGGIVAVIERGKRIAAEAREGDLNGVLEEVLGFFDSGNKEVVAPPTAVKEAEKGGAKFPNASYNGLEIGDANLIKIISEGLVINDGVEITDAWVGSDIHAEFTGMEYGTVITQLLWDGEPCCEMQQFTAAIGESDTAKYRFPQYQNKMGPGAHTLEIVGGYLSGYGNKGDVVTWVKSFVKIEINVI